jgi:uncharacterized protein YlxW (UPF0749 family)
LELFRNPLDPGYADAADRRAREGARPAGRRRTAFAARTVTLLLTGVLLAVSYQHAMAAEPDRSRAHAGLVEEIRGAQEHTDGLQTQVDHLREEVSRLRGLTLGEDSDELRQIRQREASTGLARVTGDGVVVRVADAPSAIDPTTGRAIKDAEGRVLDVDLQDVVNGLWNAGAEAVAINGQRLTATSTIRAAGGAILVDFRPVASPYEVSAIGPDELADDFGNSTAANRMRGLAGHYGLEFGVRDANDLELPAAATDIPLHYARRPAPPTSAAPSGPPGTPGPSGAPATPGPSGGSPGSPGGTPQPTGGG